MQFHGRTIHPPMTEIPQNRPRPFHLRQPHKPPLHSNPDHQAQQTALPIYRDITHGRLQPTSFLPLEPPANNDCLKVHRPAISLCCDNQSTPQPPPQPPNDCCKHRQTSPKCASLLFPCDANALATSATYCPISQDVSDRRAESKHPPQANATHPKVGANSTGPQIAHPVHSSPRAPRKRQAQQFSQTPRSHRVIPRLSL